MKNTITIGAGTAQPLTFKRFGFGTMRLTGEYIWGEPTIRNEAIEILQHASANDILFLDTADFYGPNVTNRLIAEALYPYQDDLVICTKVGTKRGADKSWNTFNAPKNLRVSVENNLKVLKLEQLKLVHLRIMPESPTPFEKSLQTMFAMQQEGKILHVGLSNASLTELKTAMRMGNIASVQNAYSYSQRKSFVQYGQKYRGMQEVMEFCTTHQIPMIPFWSLQNTSAASQKKISILAKKYKATSSQIQLAWLLHVNDLFLPIPGTAQLKHFKENIRSIKIKLTQDDMEFLG